MSKSAEIQLIGHSTKDLIDKIERIKSWDNGHNYPIEVWVNGSFKMDSIENVENAIKADLAGYINSNFPNPNTCLKTGGNDDLYLVPNPNLLFGSDKFKKSRKVVTNFTPKKKKRKK